jgi:hypothetical protein
MGRIKEILANDNQTIALVDEFEVSSQRDPFFDVPYLTRRQGEVSLIIVDGKVSDPI